MSTNPRPAERQHEQLQEEEDKVKAQVEAAAQAAGKEEEKKGATPEEVTAAVQKARTEEKDKLYPQLESLRAAMQEVQETLRAERAEKEELKQKQEEAAEKRRQDKLSDTERTNEVLSRLEEQLRNERAERENFKRELDERDRKEALRKYRDGLVQAGGDQIIPELITGNSVEELDASFDRAKARFTEFANRIKEEARANVRKGMPRSTNPDTGALEEQELDESLTTYDEDKYLKDPAYRAKIQSELARAYEQQAGRA